MVIIAIHLLCLLKTIVLLPTKVFSRYITIVSENTINRAAYGLGASALSTHWARLWLPPRPHIKNPAEPCIYQICPFYSYHPILKDGIVNLEELDSRCRIAYGNRSYGYNFH